MCVILSGSGTYSNIILHYFHIASAHPALHVLKCCHHTIDQLDVAESKKYASYL